jgi:apolipoprotein D and lipocalin family protein
MKTKIILLTVFFISTLSIIISITMNAQNNGIEPVKNFDVNKYKGTWYEIARFDHSFERGLTNVSATYEFRDDGKISVFNKGIKNGIEENITGKAKLKDDNGTGFLRVSFFWFFYADYIIFYLDPYYQYAVVTSSSDKYLWILSRQAVLSDEIKNKLTGIARDKGFDTEKLIWVKQD